MKHPAKAKIPREYILAQDRVRMISVRQYRKVPLGHGFKAADVTDLYKFVHLMQRDNEITVGDAAKEMGRSITWIINAYTHLNRKGLM